MGNQIFFENATYAAEFLRYLADHPELAERIPEGAVVVFLPEERSPGVAAYNKWAAQTAEAYRDKPHVFVTVRSHQEPGRLYDFVLG